MPSLKRALCIQDISGIGRCSLSVVLPTLSTMGIQACPLPTALLSSHPLGFDAPVHENETDFCIDVLNSYKNQNIKFDAILSGYLCDEKQVDMVLSALKYNDNSLKIIDPVMADHGRLYSKSTIKLCSAIKQLCHYADIITPNVTESAVLLDLKPSDEPLELQLWENRLFELNGIYKNCKAIIITGAKLPSGESGNAVLILNANEKPNFKFLQYALVNENYPGTGDLFAALLCGYLLKDFDIVTAINNSANFVSEVALYTFNQATNKRYGVQFEPFLYKLNLE